jgi:hypothetical protein
MAAARHISAAAIETRASETLPAAKKNPAVCHRSLREEGKNLCRVLDMGCP